MTVWQRSKEPMMGSALLNALLRFVIFFDLENFSYEKMDCHCFCIMSHDVKTA